MIDRYRHVGLRANPFAFDLDVELVPVERGLAAPGYEPATLVQVIGDKGAGKTTQIRAWQSVTPGPYHYVSAELADRWASAPVARVVFGDEIDRMAWPVRMRWFRQIARAGSSLIVGTHTDLAAPARRAGLTVVTHCLGAVDRATLDEIVHRRIASVSIPAAVPFDLPTADVDVAFAGCGGSIRQAETLLHELIAKRVHERFLLRDRPLAR